MNRPICKLCKKEESRTDVIDSKGRRMPICLKCEDKIFGWSEDEDDE